MYDTKVVNTEHQSQQERGLGVRGPISDVTSGLIWVGAGQGGWTWSDTHLKSKHCFIESDLLHILDNF